MCIRDSSYAPRRRFGGSSGGFSSGGGSGGRSPGIPRAKPSAPALELAPGDRVTHDKYGLGKVLSCDGSGPRATATIDFGASGKVRLMLIGGVPMQKL